MPSCALRLLWWLTTGQASVLAGQSSKQVLLDRWAHAHHRGFLWASLSARLPVVIVCLLCRVFKGRWHGMDVAVKIMDSCTAETLPRVLKEAEVMMGLEHHNIVKAFQCSVWSKKQQEEMMKVRGG